tara:strand:+ start:187 stop:486 length:300 start_codon:yes stop_codon:yes gene_type:complete
MTDLTHENEVLKFRLLQLSCALNAYSEISSCLPIVLTCAEREVANSPTELNKEIKNLLADMLRTIDSISESEAVITAISEFKQGRILFKAKDLLKKQKD